jgi:hypothetical protein
MNCFVDDTIQKSFKELRDCIDMYENAKALGEDQDAIKEKGRRMLDATGRYEGALSDWIRQ